MRMMTPNDKQIEIMARLVRPWLEKMKYNPQVFWELPHHHRVLLYNLVCAGGQHPSDLQLKQLYKALRSTEGRIEGYSSDPVDYLTNEQLMAYFCLETPDERRNYLEKF